MMVRCPTHGLSGVCIHSSALLLPRADGELPEVVTVEVKDTAEEEAFFRFNVTPEEAAALPIVEGRVPFDLETFNFMEGLIDSCNLCFREQRQAGRVEKAFPNS